MRKDQTRPSASTRAESPIGVSTGRVDEQRERPPELEQLNVFIGRWITEGETVAEPGAPAMTIVASDVYQWLPGEYFVMHPAYGRIGAIGVGGLEIIGFDPTTRQFQCYFFDSQGIQPERRYRVATTSGLGKKRTHVVPASSRTTARR